MLKPLLTLVFCCACSSLFADDVSQSVYKMDSFETPVLKPVIALLAPSEDEMDLIELSDLKLDQTQVREPAQIFVSQSLPFTPVVCLSAKIDPSLLWPRPRLELQWLMADRP